MSKIHSAVNKKRLQERGEKEQVLWTQDKNVDKYSCGKDNRYSDKGDRGKDLEGKQCNDEQNEEQWIEV